MKRPVMLLVLLFCLAIGNAQVKKAIDKKPSKKSAQLQKKLVDTQSGDTVISLTSTSANAAKAAPSISNNTSNQFRVSDPMVVALGERAKGHEVFISNSGIVGMPKRAYGFANGHILLHSTVATSSGSTGGTSSVGTGGSVSGMGSSGSFIGMNGKSPYAGQAMWGNARGMMIY